MALNIKGLFTTEAIVRRLLKAAKISTPVMDLIYINRPQLGLPVVGSDEIKNVVRAMPVIRRGGASISVAGETGATVFYEPLSIRPNVMVVGAALNNLKMLGTSGLEAWANSKTETLRQICRKTAEAEAAVSLSGKFSWPVQLENGTFEDWDIDFGDVLTIDMANFKMWDAADVKITHIFDLLDGMEEQIQDKGYGGTIEIWAGKKAYSTLLGICEDVKTTAKMKVEVTDKGIIIGGFQVKRRNERNYNPKSKEMVPVVADKAIKMVATDAGHMMPYCALDDLDANLQPLPFFVKPIPNSDPSGWKLVAESKPFPCPNVDGICDAVVLA